MKQVTPARGRFSNQALKAMILPLLCEQLLAMLVGLADTYIISFTGESSVSGVSLVNSFNTILIYLFTALASGGAVVVSQYIGHQSYEEGSKACNTLLIASTALGILLTALIVPLHRQILTLLFGRVESEVMRACVTYILITAVGFPALAIYNAGAAVHRSMGKTRTTMVVSMMANLINIVGNLIGVFVLKAGVAGVAWPTAIAHWFSAVAMTWCCFRPDNPVRYRAREFFPMDAKLLKRILGIAIPNGVESGIFQLVKVVLSSVIALFGTYQIAANGIAQSIWSLAAVMSIAMGPVFTTVIGQCMGAGATDEAQYYFLKLLRITTVLSVAWNGIILALMPLFIRTYAVSEETKRLVMMLVVIHNVFNGFMLPLSSPFGNGLRAAGDVFFTMAVSIGSTVFGRLALSLLLALGFRLGVVGIAFAMAADWCIRAAIFFLRFRSGKWKNFRII